jgi:hypothetical protein
MSILAIIADPGKGGTFLAWSLHFLAGHEKHFFAKDNVWMNLADDPITEKNAHGFKSNQVTSSKEFESYTNNLLNCNTADFHTIYFHQFNERPYTVNNNFEETKKALSKVEKICKKKIILTNQRKNSLYETSTRYRILHWSLRDPNIQNSSAEEQFEDFIEFFFKDDIEHWKKLNLTDIWDQREFLALNYRHGYTASTMSSLIDLSTEHYSVDCMEWFNTAESFMENLFEYLEVPMCLDRFEQWKNVYHAWRTLHFQRLNFLWCFDKIIDHILTGKYMDLTRFDLDLLQESVIQHELIYNHNLNLKTWQLEKFVNTQQLHNLLEPNTHPLTAYNTVKI